MNQNSSEYEALRQKYRETDLALAELYHHVSKDTDETSEQLKPCFIPTKENLDKARKEQEELAKRVEALETPDAVTALMKHHFADFLDSLGYAIDSSEHHPESIYLGFDSLLESVSRCNRQPDQERLEGLLDLLKQKEEESGTVQKLILEQTPEKNRADLSASLVSSAALVSEEIARIPAYFPGFTQTMSETLQKALETYAETLKKMASGISPDGTDAASSESREEDLARHLKMSPEEYRILLQKKLGVNLDEMSSWYEEEMDKTRDEIFAIAGSLEIREKPQNMQDIADILFKYEPPCSSAEEMFEREREYLKRTRKVAHEYVKLPEEEQCFVMPTPECCRNSYPWGGYEGGDFRYRPLRGQMFLNQYNVKNISDGWLKLNSLHEAYPGHHVQYVRMAVDERPATVKIGTKLIPVLEGTTLRTERAFQDTFAEDKFFPLFVAYRRHHAATRIAVDLMLHCQDRSIGDAVALYQKELGLDFTTARGQVRAHESMTGYFTCYYYGMKKLTGWEKQYGFSRKDFTELLFSAGYISIDRFEEILKLTAEEQYRLFHDFGSLEGKTAPGF